MRCHVYRARPSEMESIRRMDALCFPGHTPDFLDDDIWHVAVLKPRKIIGYIGLRLVQDGRVGYHHRVGVVPEYRGQGVQKRLTYRLIRWARAHHLEKLITYTTRHSVISANNLIDCGFRLHIPEFGITEGDWLYFALPIAKRV